MIEDQAERAGRRMLAREVMVIEVGARGIVTAADVDDGDLRIVETISATLSQIQDRP